MLWRDRPPQTFGGAAIEKARFWGTRGGRTHNHPNPRSRKRTSCRPTIVPQTAVKPDPAAAAAAAQQIAEAKTDYQKTLAAANLQLALDTDAAGTDQQALAAAQAAYDSTVAAALLAYQQSVTDAQGDRSVADAQSGDDYVDEVYGEDGAYQTWQDAISGAEAAYKTAESSARETRDKNLAALDAALEAALADTYADALELLATNNPSPWAARAAADARAESNKIASEQTARQTYDEAIATAQADFADTVAAAEQTRSDAQTDALCALKTTLSDENVDKATDQKTTNDTAAANGASTKKPEEETPPDAPGDVSKSVEISDDGSEVHVYMPDGTHYEFPVPDDWDDAEIRYRDPHAWPFGSLVTKAEIASFRNRLDYERAKHDWRVLITRRMQEQAESALSRWNPYRGSAWQLFEDWYATNDIVARQKVVISGDTPFTEELRKCEWFNEFRRGLQLDLARMSRLKNPISPCRLPPERRSTSACHTPRDSETWPLPQVDDVTTEGPCTRSYTGFDFWRGPVDIYDMFVGYPRGLSFTGNVADTFIGSFNGKYEITHIDLNNRTAIVRFTLRNRTGWRSATKLPFGMSIYGDEDGMVFDEYITWSETINF